MGDLLNASKLGATQRHGVMHYALARKVAPPCGKAAPASAGCAEWACSCQNISDTYDAWPGHLVGWRANNTSGSTHASRVASWWRRNECQTRAKGRPQADGPVATGSA